MNKNNEAPQEPFWDVKMPPVHKYVWVCVCRKENHKSALTSASFIYQLPDKARTFKAYYNKY